MALSRGDVSVFCHGFSILSSEPKSLTHSQATWNSCFKPLPGILITFAPTFIEGEHHVWIIFQAFQLEVWFLLYSSPEMGNASLIISFDFSCHSLLHKIVVLNQFLQPIPTPQHVSSWWFQPIWKIFVKLHHFSQGSGWKINIIEIHHPGVLVTCRWPPVIHPRDTSAIPRSMQGFDGIGTCQGSPDEGEGVGWTGRKKYGENVEKGFLPIPSMYGTLRSK